MKGNSLLRQCIARRGSSLRSISSSSCINQFPISAPNKIPSSYPKSSTTATAAKFHFSGPSLQLQRTLCSSSGSNIVLLTSEEQLNSEFKNVQDKSLPAIFYFTAVWCGPCKFIAPIIDELSKKYPHVTTYKIDIDQEGLGNALSRMNIHAVPTLHFYQNGKKAAEIVGANVQGLKDTMDELFGED